ncbi:hypothetical protein BC828DRAFT_208533 [Blastocladiella britannica]|nr:hypothetical protein BC828DRAFT_208533 [Blastocladiella britannica]
MAISFEATIGSIALPPEFTVFATQYQHARSPVDSLSGLLRSVRAHSTNIPVYTRDGAAFPELAHLSLELRFVVDKFDEHFDQASAGLSAMLARLWAQMARDSNGSHQSYANERSVHGECMAGRQTCARHERLRAFLVWRHVDRRVRYAHDPTALAKALAVIVTVYGSLQAAWCPRELAPLWPHIGRILHIVQVFRFFLTACRSIY